jgi:hypothetical protein
MWFVYDSTPLRQHLRHRRTINQSMLSGSAVRWMRQKQFAAHSPRGRITISDQQFINHTCKLKQSRLMQLLLLLPLNAAVAAAAVLLLQC